MGLAQVILSSVLSIGWMTSRDYRWSDITPSQQLRWYPCYNGFFCAKLDVPLDHQDLALGRASVPLLKFSAKAHSADGPYQGMILVNPGGPGSSGVEEVRDQGAELSMLTGSNWDIVGFDPRGMHLSEPVLDCAVNRTADQRTDHLGERDVPRLTDKYYSEYIDLGRRLGQNCQRIAGNDTQAGPHMSTAVVARDMASIVDAFAASTDGRRAATQSGLLNYYGISYGSFLGQTYASMFPEKVGRFVIDGIVDPDSYLNGSPASAIHHLDSVIGSYFIYCFEAGPVACPYARGASTPREIYERFNESLSHLKARHAEVKGWSNATDIEASLRLLKLSIFGASYDPISTFQSFAIPFLALEESIRAQNLTKFLQIMSHTLGDRLDAILDDAQFVVGVYCSDQNIQHQGKTLDDMRPFINDLEHESIIGEAWIRGVLMCLGWTIRPKETFTGPFGANTSNPILFVGNTFDAITPIEHARKSASKFNGAHLLTVDAVGHTSLFASNICALSQIKAYFQDRPFSRNESHCGLEQGPFEVQLNGSLEENLSRAGLLKFQL